MASSIRAPTLRRLAAVSTLRAPRPLLPVQRRWAQVHDVRFLTTHHTPQAVLDKYKEKLDKKAKSEGHQSIDTLRAAYADEILDLEKVRDLPEKEITAIWRLRHAANENKLCAVIPADTYAAMEELARRAPQFVLPVPHETQGAEIHFLQWVFDPVSRTSTVLFTQLSEYKIRGEFAQPHTTITHHLDLASDKGLVLMQGQLMDGRGVKPEHAKWLAMCLQRFYGAWEAGTELEGERKDRAEARKELLEWFAAGDSRFSVEKLLEEAERMG